MKRSVRPPRRLGRRRSRLGGSRRKDTHVRTGDRCRIARHLSADTIDRFKLLHNGFDDLFTIVVLPESQHGPTALPQNLVHTPVSVLVAVDLVTPPVGIGFRGRAVDGAPVPEAAVQEHNEPTTAPNDVTLKLLVGEESAVDP